jgi:hypothetical protein
MRWSVVLVLLLFAGNTGLPVAAQQPDIIQEHWYHSWPTLTLDTTDWANNYPEIVSVRSAGTTVLGRDQWVVRISDWSMETKEDGTAKEKVYIDGGHHGNEHLGTELAFLVAEYYIEGWLAGDEEAIKVLQTTELHIMIMLNADGNDIDNRWNTNAVDLNRNYDHMWSTEETRSGSGPFSEPETRNNADYMNDFVTEADLYVTMHTGTWILAYPWGFTPELPSDWELYNHIADTIHEDIDAELPVRNANAGIYPTHGTSRDYGYGVMGYPTFTFETDDEQFLPGTAQSLSDRLSVELEVMRYLIKEVWYWRARLQVDSFEISGDMIDLSVSNLGHASTANATLQFIAPSGEVLWNSSNFAVNASNNTVLSFTGDLPLQGEGNWNLYYQVRVVDASRWVNESVDISPTEIPTEDDGFFLDGHGVFDPFTVIISVLCIALIERRSKGEQYVIEERI